MSISILETIPSSAAGFCAAIGKPSSLPRFSTQPDLACFAIEGDAAELSGAEVDDDHLWPIGSEADMGEAWETLGSDHNSGAMLYGESAEVRAAFEKFAKGLAAAAAEPDWSEACDEYGEPNAALWNFANGRSLALFYLDADIHGAALELDDPLPGSMRAFFGAACDDILLHEILAPLAHAKLASEGGSLESFAAEEDIFNFDHMDPAACLSEMESFGWASFHPSASFSDKLDLAEGASHALMANAMGWHKAFDPQNPLFSELAAALRARAVRAELDSSAGAAKAARPKSSAI